MGHGEAWWPKNCSGSQQKNFQSKGGSIVRAGRGERFDRVLDALTSPIKAWDAFYSRHCKLSIGSKIKQFADVLAAQKCPKKSLKISMWNQLIWLNFSTLIGYFVLFVYKCFNTKINTFNRLRARVYITLKLGKIFIN